jgi:indole-3-glycerol phosphate synthase/phosphoribosylanthranilate isomerase
VYGRTKICGLTRPADATVAHAAGATHGGLLFVPASPRCLSLAHAELVRRGVPMAWVGVFANHPAETIAEHARALDLSAVQLHGNEDPAAVNRVRALLPPEVEVWKAVRIREHVPLRAETGAHRVLLDGWQARALGGTGTAFDWSKLSTYPERSDVVLAGGLNRSNAAAAAALGTWALDVSSGVESAPGIKDTGLVQQFLAARRHLSGRGDGIQ